MNNEEFHKGLASLRKISMTAAEKRAIFERVIPPAPVKSPWSVYSFSSWVRRRNAMYAFVAAILVMGLAGGSVAYAAQTSLPGDALYGVKVNMIEPFQSSLALSPSAKAELQASFANERMQEGEALAAEGKLDSAKQVELSNLITEHTEVLNQNLMAVASSDPTEAANISTDFQTRMNGYEHSLYAFLQATTSPSTDSVAVASSTASSTMPRTGGNRQAEATSTRNGNNKYGRGSNGPVSKGTYGGFGATTTIMVNPEAPNATATLSVETASTSSTTTSRSFDNHGDNHSQQQNENDNATILNLAASAQASSNDVSSWHNFQQNSDSGGQNPHDSQQNNQHGLPSSSISPGL